MNKDNLSETEQLEQLLSLVKETHERLYEIEDAVQNIILNKQLTEDLEELFENYNKVGTVAPFKNIPDDTWMLCDGSKLKIDEYPELFNSIGYQFGGYNDVFVLPNLIKYDNGILSNVNNYIKYK